METSVMKMTLQSMDPSVALLGLAGLLLCLMQRVAQVDAHFTFDLDLLSSSTSGTCDLVIFTECETYLRFCLRGMRSDRSRNIDDCPLGNFGRIDEINLPSMASISSDNPWPGSFQLYIKAMDEDVDEDDDLDFIFIDDTRQPLQGYTTSMAVTGESRRVTVTLRFQVRCQNGYHGQDCNVICEANERCYSNGTVECVTGWQSPETHCNTPICTAGCHPVGGTCSTPGQCECNQGWGGDLCDQCTPAPGCHPVGGYCSTPGQCECNQGWGGDLCDQCTPAPGCHPVGGYCSTPGQCECNQGWGGDLCDQCTPAPGCSEVGGFCNIPGECLCRTGFGPPGMCYEAHNACDDSPCEDGATCTTELGTENYICHCPPGFTGPSCGTNIDDCEEESCPENSSCEDGINSFRCVCNNGYNCTETASNKEGGLSVGATVAISAVLVFFIAGATLAVLITYKCVRRREKSNRLAYLPSPEAPKSEPVYDEVQPPPVDTMDMKECVAYAPPQPVDMIEMKECVAYAPPRPVDMIEMNKCVAYAPVSH